VHLRVIIICTTTGISLFRSASRRFCTVCKPKNSVPYQQSKRYVIPSGRPSVLSTIRPDNMSYRPDAHLSKASSVQTTRTFRPDLPLSRSFDLLQLASVRTFQQHIRTTLSVRQASGFLSKSQLWEDRCNRPDDVDSRPNALIHKVSIAIQIQTSGRQSAWSGRECIRYGNCVHQINRPNDHPPGLDARSLYMEITCSGRAIVRTTGHHCPDAAQKQERITAKFSDN
jgi:hypothetical protein